jgi:hypothetical protein
MQPVTARVPPVLALALLLTLVVGCSDDCVSSCEARQACADATDVEKKMNCDDTCEHLDDIGDPSSCDDHIDEYTSCEADLDDVCKDDSTCDGKFDAALACLATYCEARPSDAQCAAVGADFGLRF